MEFIKQRTAERESRAAARAAAAAAEAPPVAAEPAGPPKAAPKLLPGGVNLFFSEEELDAGEALMAAVAATCVVHRCGGSGLPDPPGQPPASLAPLPANPPRAGSLSPAWRPTLVPPPLVPPPAAVQCSLPTRTRWWC